MAILADSTVRVRIPKSFHVQYHPGQYVFLNFSKIDTRQFHPYSLTPGPHEPFLEVHIKALGNHTEKLVGVAAMVNLSNSAATSVSIERGAFDLMTKVKVDGPYGNLGHSHKDCSFLVLVGGGIGVTPLISVIKDIYKFGATEQERKRLPRTNLKNVVLVWTASSISSS